MFNNLQGLALGIIGFAIIIGIGTLVLGKFAGTQADCATGFTYEGNATTGVCANDTNTLDGDYAPTGTPWVSINYLNTQMGTTGLAGWTPAIVALAVGMLFLGAFMLKGKNKQ